MEGFRARDPGGLERCAESSPPLSRSLRNGREGSHSGVRFADTNPQGLAGERRVDVFSKMNSAECFLLDAHALAPCGRGAPGPRPLNARPVSRLESPTPATHGRSGPGRGVPRPRSKGPRGGPERVDGGCINFCGNRNRPNRVGPAGRDWTLRHVVEGMMGSVDGPLGPGKTAQGQRPGFRDASKAKPEEV